MLRFAFVLMFSMLFLLCAGADRAAAAGKKKAPALGVGIAATVNSDLITTGDVDGRVNMALQGANIQPSPEDLRTIRKQALEALIDEQVRLQEAARQEVLPEKEEMDAAFATLAQQNRMSPEQFTAMLKKTAGVYESLQRQIKTQIAWNNVVRKRIRPQVDVTENDINAYLEERERNTAKTEYQVAEIFMKNSDDNRKLAGHLISEMRKGKLRFSQAARQFSQGLEASKGGLLGWIEEKRLEPALDDVITRTPVGEVSDVVTSRRGLHILLVLNKRDILATSEASQRLHVKQIALALPRDVPEQIHKQAAEHMAFLRKESKNCEVIDEVIAKINSPMARDMGQVRLADLPPPVVPVVKDLPVGKISETIRTPDGYALYMVCGREENSEETVRNDIADMIGNERLNRLQQRYYRDLRAASYIDIKE